MDPAVEEPLEDDVEAAEPVDPVVAELVPVAVVVVPVAVEPVELVVVAAELVELDVVPVGEVVEPEDPELDVAAPLNGPPEPELPVPLEVPATEEVPPEAEALLVPERPVEATPLAPLLAVAEALPEVPRDVPAVAGVAAPEVVAATGDALEPAPAEPCAALPEQPRPISSRGAPIRRASGATRIERITPDDGWLRKVEAASVIVPDGGDARIEASERVHERDRRCVRRSESVVPIRRASVAGRLRKSAGGLSFPLSMASITAEMVIEVPPTLTLFRDEGASSVRSLIMV